MRLTNREKVYLGSLLIIALIWGYYEFLLTPQFDSINTMKVEADGLRFEKQRLDAILATENIIEEDLKKTVESLDKLKGGYFTHIDQGELIMILEDFIETSGAEVANIGFNQIRLEPVGVSSLETMSVNWSYKTTYQSLMALLHDITNFSKRIIVKSLDITSDIDGFVAGSINFDFYSLSSIIDDREQMVEWKDQDNYRPENPFKPFMSMDTYQPPDIYIPMPIPGPSIPIITIPTYTEAPQVKIEFSQGKVLLESFDDGNMDYRASNRAARIGVGKDTNRRIGENSTRVEYNFPESKEKESVLLYLGDRNLKLNQAPKAMGIWVHSYQPSDAVIQLGLKGTDGDIYNVSLAQKIDWTGWKYITVTPPQIKSIYPMVVEGITIQLPKEDRAVGVLLFDGLEAIYDVERFTESVIEPTGGFVYYEVKAGDSLNGIAQKFYGDANNVEGIIRYNNISPQNPIIPGKVLIIPKD